MLATCTYLLCLNWSLNLFALFSTCLYLYRLGLIFMYVCHFRSTYSRVCVCLVIGNLQGPNDGVVAEC